MSTEQQWKLLAVVAAIAGLGIAYVVRRNTVLRSFRARFEECFRTAFYHLDADEQDAVLRYAHGAIGDLHYQVRNEWWQLSQIGVELVTRKIIEQLAALRLGYSWSFHEERLLEAFSNAWPHRFPYEETVRQTFDEPVAAA